ncbi:hypothetical protein [Marinomonas spartinae]|uniref:hypothetical protein n=1 Tax=Marinomonas spartinae TaxID=1792290 RepID=UPI001F32EC54|nr:hypothetical protein [Marinomonas spartinae]
MMLIGDNTGSLEAASDRECEFYIQYLTSHAKSVSLRNLRASSKEERMERINEEIQLLIRKNRAPKDVIYQMQAAFEATQVSSGDFKWVDKRNDRMMIWMWHFLKRQTESAPSTLVFLNEEEEAHFTLLSPYPFKTERNTHSERFADIMAAFHYSEAEPEQQQALIGLLREQWQTVLLDKSVVDWLEEENLLQWKWAWKYLENITQRPLKKAWEPIDDQQLYMAIIATFDLADNPDRKALLVDKMKKAWSQKKFREKTNGKKPYSISMTLSTKQQLDVIAKEKGLKINDTIEELIKKEYAKRSV